MLCTADFLKLYVVYGCIIIKLENVTFPAVLAVKFLQKSVTVRTEEEGTSSCWFTFSLWTGSTENTRNTCMQHPSPNQFHEHINCVLTANTK